MPQDECPLQPPDTTNTFDPCPLCGRSGIPFDRRVSALLDWLELLEQTVQDVKRAAEDLVA